MHHRCAGPRACGSSYPESVTCCCQPLHAPSNASGTQRRTSQDDATGRCRDFSRNQHLTAPPSPSAAVAASLQLHGGHVVRRLGKHCPRSFHQRLHREDENIRHAYGHNRLTRRTTYQRVGPRRRLSGRISIDAAYGRHTRRRCQDMSVRDAPPCPKRLLILLVWLRPTGTCLCQIAGRAS